MGKNKITISLAVVIGILIILNLLACFTPEVGFDAIWYHLVLPKLWLWKRQWFFDGGLLYYSAMPRLAETIFIPLVQFTGFVGPKLVQFFSGLGCIYLLYRFVRRFTDSKLLIISGISVFYATWLVSWESSSAYVDLIRTFLETSALFVLTKDKKLITKDKIIAGIFLGLAIGTKWHSLISLILASVIFSPIIIFPALIVASPWFYLAYRFTGSPFYPLFEKFMQDTQTSQVPKDFFSPLRIISRLITLPVILHRVYDDFLSPIVGAIYTLAYPVLFSSNIIIRKIALYGILGTIIYILIPPPSGRYFLPYLIPLIVSAIYLINKLKPRYHQYFAFVCLLSALSILFLRSFAFMKYLPFLSGRVGVQEYLTSQSDKLPGTFIDSDNFVKEKLPSNAKYLISNLHNLYYFPYNFDHNSWAKPGEKFDYLITIGEDISSYPNSELLHTNQIGIQIIKLK